MATRKKPAAAPPAPPAKKPKAKPEAKAKAAVSPEERFSMVARAAYFIAERRGFADGDPVQDWLVAECQVEALLAARNRPGAAPRRGADRALHGGSRPSSGSPMRTRAPSATDPARANPRGAKTMIVEPCSNQPISSPFASRARQAMTLGPR